MTLGGVVMCFSTMAVPRGLPAPYRRQVSRKRSAHRSNFTGGIGAASTHRRVAAIPLYSATPDAVSLHPASGLGSYYSHFLQLKIQYGTIAAISIMVVANGYPCAH